MTFTARIAETQNTTLFCTSRLHRLLYIGVHKLVNGQKLIKLDIQTLLFTEGMELTFKRVATSEACRSLMFWPSSHRTR